MVCNSASAMDAQDKKMCTLDEYAHGLYVDDDYLGGLICNIMDYSVESLDGDDLSEDWASDLGPFPEILPPVGIGNAGGGGGRGGGSAGFLADWGGPNVRNCEAKFQPNIHKEVLKSQQKPKLWSTFSHEQKSYRVSKSFEPPSPDSVLENDRTSSSTQKTSSEIFIPVKIRSRLRSGPGLITNSWSKSLKQFPFRKVKKKIRLAKQHDVNKVKKCHHCAITKTPQWREGPMGPRTLCNACGVRYRSRRLFPEYRPAASPTFVPALHSNSHRKVVEMRLKGAMNNNSLSSNSTF
ncbi:hypothetical protein R6Q59_024339 [Mikania micrantha]|uniref:GATA-type domain-containing protein n=1 Tax=Mikania micrantha TaxID=192012 RepID=A0A5N6P3T5_9ASTR|nr:hypothetical protein E3N88_14817 [Mikania micrantha]